MHVDNGIQLKRCARQARASELSSSESGSNGGKGLTRLLSTLLVLFSSRPINGECLLLLLWGGDNEEKSSSDSPRSTALSEDSPCVGEGGGVAVLTILLCFSRIFSRNVPNIVRRPGT